MDNIVPIVVAILLIIVIWWFFLRKSVDSIMVPASDLDISNIPKSITFNKKEYKSSGTKGTFNVGGKDNPLYYVFGTGSDTRLGYPKNKFRTTCSNDVTISEGKYGLYDQDENWCIYNKKI